MTGVEFYTWVSREFAAPRTFNGKWFVSKFGIEVEYLIKNNYSVHDQNQIISTFSKLSKILK